MIENIFDAIAKSFSSDASFISSLGKAIMIFAFIAPLAYCESKSSMNRAHKDIAKTEANLEMKKLCLEARGRWIVAGGRCSLHN